MKKIIFILIASCTLSPLYAQIHEAGIKGGANFANLHGDVDDNHIKIGPHLGGYINFEILDDLYFQPELLYSLQGASFKNEEVNMNYKDHLHYINLPLLVNYYLTEEISVHGGAYIGAFLFGKRKGNQFGQEINEAIENIKFLDFGLVLGVGYTLRNDLTIGARYNLGIANIADHETDFEGFDDYMYEYSYDLTLSNQVLQVYAAFPLFSKR